MKLSIRASDGWREIQLHGATKVRIETEEGTFDINETMENDILRTVIRTENQMFVVPKSSNCIHIAER